MCRAKSTVAPALSLDEHAWRPCAWFCSTLLLNTCALGRRLFCIVWWRSSLPTGDTLFGGAMHAPVAAPRTCLGTSLRCSSRRTRAPLRLGARVTASAQKADSAGDEDTPRASGSGSGVDFLGPIGMSLGPIGMSLGASQQRESAAADAESVSAAEAVRLNALSTEEWKRTHVRDGACGLHTCAADSPSVPGANTLLTRVSQTALWTCGWRTTSMPRPACLPVGRTGGGRMWRGQARRRRMRGWLCTPSTSSELPANLLAPHPCMA